MFPGHRPRGLTRWTRQARDFFDARRIAVNTPPTVIMAITNPGIPVIRHIANLWSLRDTPNTKKPWSLEGKIAAVKEAGFDGFTDLATSAHRKWAEKHGLMIVGHFSSSKPDEFRALLQQNQAAGARHINAQLGDHDTSTSDAVRMALRLIHEGTALGLEPAVEIHRGTCTETPEKSYALADGYRRITNQLLPFSWDFSHIAVVKHLAPPFWERLLVRPDLIQRASQFHFRPFNGHHCQIPVTDGHGELTDEFNDWLPFVEKCFETWLQGNQAGREIIVVPDLGPASSGYNLHQHPEVWSEAVKLRGLLDAIWKKVAAKAAKKKRK
jgi:hypothetical protein